MFKLMTNPIGDMNGYCNETGQCDRNMKQIMDKRFDYFGAQLPLTTYNFSSATFPGHVDSVNWEVDYRIATNYAPVEDAACERDVIESVAVFSADLICYFTLLMVLCYLTSVAVRKVMDVHAQVKRPASKDSFCWQMLTVLLNNMSLSDYAYFSLRILMSTVVVGVFYMVQYYNGYFSTDLVVMKEASKINSLADLASDPLERQPIWLQVDPSMDDFRIGKSAEHTKIWQRHLATPNASRDNIVSTSAEADSVEYVLRKLAAREGAMICPSPAAVMLHMVYCFKHKNDADRTFHVAEQGFDRSLYGGFFSLESSVEIRQRLHRQTMRLFEGKLVQKELYDKVMGQGMAYVDMDNDLRTCLGIMSAEQSVESIKVPLENVKVLMQFCVFSTLSAISVVIAEKAINLFVMQKRALKKMRRRQRVRIRLENVSLQNRGLKQTKMVRV